MKKATRAGANHDACSVQKGCDVAVILGSEGGSTNAYASLACLASRRVRLPWRVRLRAHLSCPLGFNKFPQQGLPFLLQYVRVRHPRRVPSPGNTGTQSGTARCTVRMMKGLSHRFVRMVPLADQPQVSAWALPVQARPLPNHPLIAILQGRETVSNTVPGIFDLACSSRQRHCRPAAVQPPLACAYEHVHIKCNDGKIEMVKICLRIGLLALGMSLLIPALLIVSASVAPAASTSGPSCARPAGSDEINGFPLAGHASDDCNIGNGSCPPNYR